MSDSALRPDMGHTVETEGQGGDNGHTGAVDAALAREWGAAPATWHSRRYGHQAANRMVARIITTWGRHGNLADLAGWIVPIEEAIARRPGGPGSRQLRAALADAGEDAAEARFLADPTPETARELLRARAAERLHSLDHDREIAERFGITL